MKRNPHYMLREIAGIPYLHPFGQMIANHRPGLRLNETGVFLWNLLEKELSFEEIVCRCAEYYEIQADSESLCGNAHQETCDEFTSLKKDLEEFIGQLIHLEIVLTDTTNTAPKSSNRNYCHNPSPVSYANSSMNSSMDSSMDNSTDSCGNFAGNYVLTEKHLTIGGLNLRFNGPADAFSSSFEKFYTAPTSPIHQSITIHTVTEPEGDYCSGTGSFDADCLDGTLLIQDPELQVTETTDKYILHFPTSCQILMGALSKDGSRADFYCTPPYTMDLREALFHAIRLSFLYLAQREDMVVLHSASFLYQEKAWLFTGPSGTGKSTHTNLWNKLFAAEIKLLNGDLNLLAFQNGKPVIHGLPWCGTSKICDTQTIPLGGIIVLKQAPNDIVIQLPIEEMLLRVAHRLISPTWTADLLEKNLCFIERIYPHIMVCQLNCTKEDSAAITMKNYIDRYTKGFQDYS